MKSNTYFKKNRTKTIDGQECREGRRIGYCHCNLHPGFITASLLKEHDCVGKECRYFQKYEEAQYWQQKEKQKKDRKEAQKREKERIKTEEYITDIARAETKDVEGLYIINTQLDSEKGLYIIRYISTKYIDNIYELQCAINAKVNKSCRMVCIKTTAEIKAGLIKKYPK